MNDHESALRLTEFTSRPLAATKFEIRNPKHETNPNDRNPNVQNSLTIPSGEKLDEVSRNRSLVTQRSSQFLAIRQGLAYLDSAPQTTSWRRGDAGWLCHGSINAGSMGVT